MNEKNTPALVLIMGGVAAGKTRFRKGQYPSGYVVLDAGEMFINLSNGQYFDFPSIHKDRMQDLGKELAYRALSERRNIVCEIIGDKNESTSMMIKAVRSIGYEVDIQGVTCDTDVAIERNQSRSINNISAYFTQSYHMRWLLEAASRIYKNNAAP